MSIFSRLILLSFAGMYMAGCTSDLRPTGNTYEATDSAGVQTEWVEYRQSFMKIAFVVRPEWEVSSANILVTMRNGDESMSISRSATNSDNIVDHFAILDEAAVQNNFINNLKDREFLNLGDYDAYLLFKNNIESSSPERKIYFIYADHYIFQISTDSPDLYDDLDQVAMSFRYLGEE